MRGYELTGKREYLDCARAVGHHRPAVRLPVELQAGHGLRHHARVRRDQLARPELDRPAGAVVRLRLRLRPDHARALRHDARWRQVAKGILVAAEQMQYPDGQYAGCVPDSFDLPTQTRRPPAINPCAIVSLRLALEGELDSLAVAVGDESSRGLALSDDNSRRQGVHPRRNKASAISYSWTAIAWWTCHRAATMS